MCKIIRYLFSILTYFSIIAPSFSQTDSLDIYDYSFDQLSKINITSATKVTQHIEEVPSTVIVISEKEIKDRAYFTLEDILADLPGFQFRNIQGFNSYSFQRGIPNQNNLILLLIDGVQVNELNSGGFYGGGQYNLSNIEKIEAIYGPTSVAYGTNAISGIINIITKSPSKKHVDVNTLVGSFNTINTDMSYSYLNEQKNIGVLISGMTKQTDKADLKGQAGDNNWTDLIDNSELDYAFDFKIRAKDFIIGTNYLQKQASSATSVKSVGSIYKDYGTLWNIRFINNYVKYERQIFEKLNLTSCLYNRNSTVLDNSVLYVVDTAQIGYYRPNNLTGLENVLNYKAGNFFSITGGLILEYEELAQNFSITYSNSPDQKPPTPSKPKMEKNSLTSIFIEPQITLFKQLFISGGFRYDYSSIYNEVFTPRAGIVYKYHNQIIRLSYAEAFRAPKPWDYTDGLGNNSLLPEEMHSLEGAIGLALFDHLKFDIITYKNTLNNAITREDVINGYQWVNKGEINTDGIDLYLRYTSQKLQSSISYTYNKSYDEFNLSIPEISEHIANASINYLFKNHFNFNLRANYIGKRENTKIVTATNSKYLDPYLIFNGAFSFINYKHITIQFIVKNILNTKYYHTSNSDVERYRQSQRTVMLSVSYNLSN
ncbi:MAG TPA: hypothetical protein DCG75_15235 [Bacteroidales bacterium]|nr:hypothetical protein [Bacteroidales bacterium]